MKKDIEALASDVAEIASSLEDEMGSEVKDWDQIEDYAEDLISCARRLQREIRDARKVM